MSTSLGHPALHRREEGSVGVQRVTFHQLGNLQRDPAQSVPQHHHVSRLRLRPTDESTGGSKNR